MTTKRTVAYWGVFALVQVAGFVSLSFTNIHSNIAPLFVGIALLLPAGVLLFFIDVPFPLLASIIVAVNFATWAGLKKWGKSEWWPSK